MKLFDWLWSRRPKMGPRYSYISDEAHWAIQAPSDVGRVLRMLGTVLPQDAMLYIEIQNPAPRVRISLLELHISPKREVQEGTIWPRTDKFHIKATATDMGNLADLADKIPQEELADHLVAYTTDQVIMEWYDVGGPIILSRAVPEAKVAVFAEAIGSSFEYREVVQRS